MESLKCEFQVTIEDYLAWYIVAGMEPRRRFSGQRTCDWSLSCIGRWQLRRCWTHGVGDFTEVAYFRSDLFECQPALMGQWAEYLFDSGQTALHGTG